MNKKDLARRMKLEAESRWGKGFNRMGLMYVDKRRRYYRKSVGKNEGERMYISKDSGDQRA